MTFHREIRIARTRKPHRCTFCRHIIPAGSPATTRTGSWEDDFYSDYGHADCIRMWDTIFPVYADPSDGMAFDLLDAIGEGENDAFLEEELNIWRGKFPHAVTRLEYLMQKNAVAYADDLRAHGIEPHPEDYQPIYG